MSNPNMMNMIGKVLETVKSEAATCHTVRLKHDEAVARFRAACFTGDSAKADQCREEIHALIDIMLDSAAVIALVKRQLSDAGFNPPD